MELEKVIDERILELNGIFDHDLSVVRDVNLVILDYNTKRWVFETERMCLIFLNGMLNAMKILDEPKYYY